MRQRTGDRRQSTWDRGTEEVRQETGDRGQRNGRYGEQRIEDWQNRRGMKRKHKPLDIEAPDQNKMEIFWCFKKWLSKRTIFFTLFQNS
jgi:hypothetical protein